MNRPRVLVTGPVGELDEWCAAARGAGWEPIPWPLILLEECAPDAGFAAALERTPPDHVCLTSAHALPFLEALAKLRPELRALHATVVGQRSLGRLRALGFRGELGGHPSAEVLRAEILARAPLPARVLWPRGDKSDELARALRAAGIEVLDPIAYTNRPRPAGERPPECELVFFASPSGVRAFADSGAEHSARRALAIGPTTHEALLGGKELAFFDIISLPEPTSSSFAAALQHIDLRPKP